VIERFEKANRERNAELLCGVLLVKPSDFFGGPSRREGCRTDPELLPHRELAEVVSADKYDLVVKRVSIDPKTDRFDPDAIATVEIDSRELVRTSVGYGNAGVSYELRDEDGASLARFDVGRLGGYYHLVHRAVCEKDLKTHFG